MKLNGSVYVYGLLKSKLMVHKGHSSCKKFRLTKVYLLYLMVAAIWQYDVYLKI
jgi:hypothetical protein